MYGKLFESMYDGSLANDWKALVVFQQLIILCDAEGIVDMTVAAITRRTGIPADVVEHGIAVLESPDPESRSSDQDGRRISRLDAGRSWGWVIVNHKSYRDLASRDEKRRRDRERIAESRAVARRSDESRAVADVAHTDTNSKANTTKQATTSGAPSSDAAFDSFWEVVHCKVGKRAANKAFARACKDVAVSHGIDRRAAADLIVDAMRAFKKTPAASPTDRSPIHPTTWLNQGRYFDEVTPATSGNGSTVSKWLGGDQ
jgi:hypothetical protein